MNDIDDKIERIASTVEQGLLALGDAGTPIRGQIEVVGAWLNHAVRRALHAEELLRLRLAENPDPALEDLLEQLVDAYPLPGENDEAEA